MIEIHQGDCRDLLASLDAESIDCVIADPPYGETALEWDRWPQGWLAAVRRVLKPTGSMWVFGSLRMFMSRAGEFEGWRMAQEVVWEKHNGSNSFADRFRRVHELAAHFYRDDAQWSAVYKKPIYSADATARSVRRKQKAQHWSKIDGHHFVSVDGGPRLMRSVIYERSEHGRALHPTQKPIGLVGCLVEYACPPGGMVLDPFFGSGTTGVAAQIYGVKCIGIEGRAEYIALASERLASTSVLPLEVAA